MVHDVHGPKAAHFTDVVVRRTTYTARDGRQVAQLHISLLGDTRLLAAGRGRPNMAPTWTVERPVGRKILWLLRGLGLRTQTVSKRHRIFRMINLRSMPAPMIDDLKDGKALYAGLHPMIDTIGQRVQHTIAANGDCDLEALQRICHGVDVSWRKSSRTSKTHRKLRAIKSGLPAGVKAFIILQICQAHPEICEQIEMTPMQKLKIGDMLLAS